MMRHMSEGPGQQPPQEPRNQASDGPREVLEGRVIPSRTSDPRRGFAGPPQQERSPQEQGAQGAQPPAAGGGAPESPYSFRPGAPGAAGAAGAPGSGGQTGPGGQGGQGFQGAGPAGPAAPAAAQGGPAAPGPQGGGYGFPQQQPAQPQPQSQPQAPAAGQGPAAPGTPQQGGYGFPQQQQPGAAPGAAQGGYGFPRPQQTGGPGAGPAAPPANGPAAGADAPGTPDWSALAEEQASGAQRRRKVMMLVGGAVAVAVIAGGVATAVVVSGHHSDHPIADPSGSTGSTGRQSLPPEPSFSSVAPPSPENPLDFISSAAKDKAPLSAASLFPGKTFVLAGRTYTKTNIASTSSCAAAAGGQLSGSLAANGCTKMLRATYTNGAIAVTVGVAVFADKAHATKVHSVAQYVRPLNGGGIADFCHAVACQMTSNSVGRYAYFAISGFKNGKTLTASNTTGAQAANDASDFAFQRIVQRGRDAAQAQANSQ